MTRQMYDCTHVNVPTMAAQLGDPGMVAGYDTGSTDIKWTAADFATFPRSVHVHIDQAGTGAPVYSANVMDVESGAYSVSDIPNWTSHSTSPRPTVYCGQGDLSAVLGVWGGPIWVAIPTGSPPPSPPNPQVVAVQYNFGTVYDSSIVFDPFWPDKDERMPTGVLNDFAYVPVQAGLFKSLVLYHDYLNGSTTASIRVAVHSASGGYSQIVNPFVLNSPAPQTLSFTASDVDGVSLHLLTSTEQEVGYTFL